MTPRSPFRWPFRLATLDRKLLRDLYAMRGQAIAIALVIAAGVSMFVMYLSTFDSLQRTQRTYYERQRFADVFAGVKRAPERLLEQLTAIPGVSQVETRVVSEVLLDVPGLAEPATGRLVSLSAAHRPTLNDLHLSAGSWIDATRPDAVLASESFCTANHLRVGDTLSAIVNGRKRRLTIAGIALSPEYVFSMRPGEVVPDARRFGVLWMERRALASAFDMEGGFNDVVLGVGPGASVDDVIARVDRLLAPYGGRGATPRALQPSHWMLDSKIVQLRQFGVAVPLIFLLVAAFVLNVAMTRALALQRPQIAALKALGYRDGELAWHYLEWSLAIAAAGVVLGVMAGGWMGAGLIGLYNQFFRFPALIYRVSLDVVLGATALSLGAAALGAWTTVRRAVRVPPAEAMRPEPPARYQRSLLESIGRRARLATTTRMVLRNIERQPLRAAASVLGIGFAGAILLVGFIFVDAMSALEALQFTVADRSDVSLTFVEPRSSDALHALERLPGVRLVEPTRSVPARLRAGFRHRNLAITGMPDRPELKRIIDRGSRAVALPPGGLVLSATLAHVLAVRPGDAITVEVLEGTQPVRTIVVAGVVDDMFGVSAYMTLDALHALLREGRTLSGASLLVDPAQQDALSARLERMPAVAGVAVKRAMVENFRLTMAQSMNLTIVMNVLFAGIIAFGVVYNDARVSLSERSRELASLRVLGFTRTEISRILLGELALLTVVALPVGGAIGYGLARLIAEASASEVYRLPLTVGTTGVVPAAMVVLAASLVSGLVVRRQLNRLDLVGVLKTRE